MSLFDTVLGNIQALDPSFKPAAIKPPTTPLSRPLSLRFEDTPVRLLRDYELKRYFKNGKPRKSLIVKAGEIVDLSINGDGGLKLCRYRYVFADDSYIGSPAGYDEPPIREGVDFEFLPVDIEAKYRR